MFFNAFALDRLNTIHETINGSALLESIVSVALACGDDGERGTAVHMRLGLSGRYASRWTYYRLHALAMRTGTDAFSFSHAERFLKSLPSSYAMAMVHGRNWDEFARSMLLSYSARREILARAGEESSLVDSLVAAADGMEAPVPGESPGIAAERKALQAIIYCATALRFIDVEFVVDELERNQAPHKAEVMPWLGVVNQECGSREKGAREQTAQRILERREYQDAPASPWSRAIWRMVDDPDLITYDETMERNAESHIEFIDWIGQSRTRYWFVSNAKDFANDTAEAMLVSDGEAWWGRGSMLRDLMEVSQTVANRDAPILGAQRAIDYWWRNFGYVDLPIWRDPQQEIGHYLLAAVVLDQRRQIDNIDDGVSMALQRAAATWCAMPHGGAMTRRFDAVVSWLRDVRHEPELAIELTKAVEVLRLRKGVRDTNGDEPSRTEALEALARAMK